MTVDPRDTFQRWLPNTSTSRVHLGRYAPEILDAA